MVKTSLLVCLLALLAAAAPPASASRLLSPERHGQRKMPGDFTHHYGTYRNHSHQDRPLFGFLRGNGRATARHRAAHHNKSGHRRTTGLF